MVYSNSPYLKTSDYHKVELLGSYWTYNSLFIRFYSMNQRSPPFAAIWPPWRVWNIPKPRYVIKMQLVNSPVTRSLMLRMFLLKISLMPHSTLTIQALLTPKMAEIQPSKEIRSHWTLQLRKNKSHIPTKLIELGHDSPQKINLTKISNVEKSFKGGFDSDGGRGPFMEAVDGGVNKISRKNCWARMKRIPMPRKMIQSQVKFLHFNSQW